MKQFLSESETQNELKYLMDHIWKWNNFYLKIKHKESKKLMEHYWKWNIKEIKRFKKV